MTYYILGQSCNCSQYDGAGLKCIFTRFEVKVLMLVSAGKKPFYQGEDDAEEDTAAEWRSQLQTSDYNMRVFCTVLIYMSLI